MCYYIGTRNRMRNKEWHTRCQLGYSTYIKQQDWQHDFCKEKYTSADCECCYLSQYVFGYLVKKFSKYSEFIPHTSNHIEFLNGNGGNSVYYHFDIMNNPKISESNNKNNRLGNRLRKSNYEAERIELEDLYFHSIGNIAPIPWVKGTNSNKIVKEFNLQTIHSNKFERWDLLLIYLKENWSTNFNENSFGQYSDLTFEEYIIGTCQQLYYNNIYDDLCDKIKLKPFDAISVDEWCDWITDWNEKIINGQAGQIISFEEKENRDILSIACDVRILIESRGRCILALLSA